MARHSQSAKVPPSMADFAQAAVARRVSTRRSGCGTACSSSAAGRWFSLAEGHPLRFFLAVGIAIVIEVINGMRPERQADELAQHDISSWASDSSWS